MTFSLIIPWRSGNPIRERHLENVIRCIKLQNHNTVFELIVIEQMKKNEFKDHHERTIKIIPRATIHNWVRYVQAFNESDYFNKSWLMNIGAVLANYQYLIFIDADTLFEKDFLDKVQSYIDANIQNKMFMCWDELIAMEGKDNPRRRFIRPPMTVALGGIWCAERQYYFSEFGGMCENFWGYGGEDNEAYERAVLLLDIPTPNFHMMRYTLTHQYHDWEKPHNDATSLFLKCRAHSLEICKRIKERGIGRLDAPSLIRLDDLT